jgi:hypothetical protein
MLTFYLFSLLSISGLMGFWKDFFKIMMKKEIYTTFVTFYQLNGQCSLEQ